MKAALLSLVCLFTLGACNKPPAASPLAEKGKSLADQYGCVSCHNADGTRSIGPTWKGLYGSTVQFDDGSSTIADARYLLESIKDPSARTVKDFPKGVMASVIKPGSVPDADARALIAYIESLR